MAAQWRTQRANQQARYLGGGGGGGGGLGGLPQENFEFWEIVSGAILG